MKRLEFLALLTSPALIFIPKKEKGVGLYIDGKLITTLDQVTFKPYRMTAKNIHVSDELIKAIK